MHVIESQIPIKLKSKAHEGSADLSDANEEAYYSDTFHGLSALYVVSRLDNYLRDRLE